MKKNIAIVAGGDSSEFEISLKSAQRVSRIIDDVKYNSHIIQVKGKDWIVKSIQHKEVKINKEDFTFNVNNYSKTRFDCAILMIHGSPGEDGKLPAYFDLLKIPYISSGVLASSLSFHKFHCNNYIKSFGVTIPKSVLIKSVDDIRPVKIVENLGLPCFVKPNASGSSFGVTKVKQMNELVNAIEKAQQESSEVIIEEFIDGTEVTCGLYKTAKREIIFPLTEIVSKKEFFDYEAKYDSKFSEEITPARISEDMETECKKIASLIYEALNCKGIVRLDFIIRNNKIYFLEANTIPGMSENSIIPKQVISMGLSLKEIFNELIEESVVDQTVII